MNELVKQFRTGSMIQRELIEGLDDESAYRLIISVKAIERIIGR